MILGNLVNLIAVEEEHLELIRKWRTSPHVYETLFEMAFITKYQQKNWYQSILNDKTKKYMLIEDKNNKGIGLIYLYNIDYLNRMSEWGFFIGDEDARLSGYAAEAEFLLLKYVFDTLNLNKLYCNTFEFNKKVVSMHKKFNFKQEGFLRNHIYHNGKYENVILMSILKDEFYEVKDKYETLFKKVK